MLLTDGHVIDGAELGRHQAMLRIGLFHHAQLLVTRLDLLDSLFITFSKHLMLVVLDADRAGLDVLVSRPFRRCITRDKLLRHLVIHSDLILILGLVSRFKCIVITQSRVDLLLDNSAHNALQLVAHRIQKCMFVINFLLRKRSHGNQLVEEPLVSLSKKAEFDIHVALIHNKDELFAQALVEPHTIVLCEARLPDHILLLLVWSTIRSYFLAVQVEG